VPPLDADPVPFARRAWFRPTAPVPDDPLLHLQALAYLSDHGPTRAAREPHAHLADDARRMSVSLDHSVWFHRPIDVNQWLLSELVPVATGRGRGLSIGTLRTVDGTLVATVAQEVLLRERRRVAERRGAVSRSGRDASPGAAGTRLPERPGPDCRQVLGNRATTTDATARLRPRRTDSWPLWAWRPLVHWVPL
jgi:hypothetical protein